MSKKLINQSDDREFTEKGDLVVEKNEALGSQLVQTGEVVIRGREKPIKLSWQKTRQLQTYIARYPTKKIIPVSATLTINTADITSIEMVYETEAIPGWRPTTVDPEVKDGKIQQWGHWYDRGVRATTGRVTVRANRLLETDDNPTDNGDGTFTVTRTMVARTTNNLHKDVEEVFGVTPVEEKMQDSIRSGKVSELWQEAMARNKAILADGNQREGMWYVIGGKLAQRRSKVTEGGNLIWLD